MECLGDGRRAGYYCKPVDDSAATADRASCAPDLSSAYKYVANSYSHSSQCRSSSNPLRTRSLELAYDRDNSAQLQLD